MMNFCICSDFGVKCDTSTLKHVVTRKHGLVVSKGPVCAEHRKYYEENHFTLTEYTPDGLKDKEKQ